MRLTGINANLAEAEAAFKRIDKFFELPEKKEISFQPTESNSVLAALKGISFGYPEQDKKVFCDLSHDFQAASTTLLWGPSGCGKSTLLKVLYGHLEAEGTLCRKDCRWGILPQAPNLFNITLRENFRLAKPGIDDKEINTFLNKVGMLEDVMAKGQGLDLKIESAENMFSGGQHRRLCIAVFLAADFDALLFDEPTASLDAEKIRLVAGILAELERGKNKSIIIATHEESLREIAVNVMMLDTGSAD
ncbi:MAG: ATP-binding cassette domain-containing protein [Treponema sp.]|nr:ATP-binding cassette domain-containing protein [Treponema sp.]